MHIFGTAHLTAGMEPRLFDLDYQLLADSLLTIVAVFVLFFALSYFLFDPARKFLQKRQEKIAGELENARTQEEEAAKLKEEYEAKLADIEKEADEILSAARRKGLANETHIVEAAKEEAARIIARANVEAELEKKKAADEVKREMIVIAAAMAAKIAGASMSAEKQDALLEETLAEIGESTWLS